MGGVPEAGSAAAAAAGGSVADVDALAADLSKKVQLGDGVAAPTADTAAGTAAGAATTVCGAGGGALAGCEDALEALREVIGWRAAYRQQGAALGVRWPTGVLLHGPPGSGKTSMVRQVAREYGAALHTVTAGTVVGAFMGESERRLRECFEAAAADSAKGKVAVVFLDEADALAPRRGPGAGHEARVVAQLLTLLDGAAARPAPPSPPPLAAALPSPAPPREGNSGSLPRAAAAAAAAAAAGGGVDPMADNGASGGGNDGGSGGAVVVVAATSRPNVLDPALRRPGRLDREVAVPVPDAKAREAILRAHTAALPLSPGFDLGALAGRCSGYTGADLAALCREAAMEAMGRALQHAGGSMGDVGSTGVAGSNGAAAQSSGGGSAAPAPAQAASLEAGAAVVWDDFEAALARVGPSVARGAAVEVQPVAWDEIGGLHGVKRRLQQAVEWPVRHADSFARLGLHPPRGVLLHGPPGCSKTTLARAAATAARCPLLPLSGAQLYSMYVGDGEALLRERFRQARLAAPAIVFLDEIDALAGKRSDAPGGGEGGVGGGSAGVRLLSALLTEMDGLELATGVLVLAATNRPDCVDAALLRPGRFDSVLFVPPPDEEGRAEVLRLATQRMPLTPDVDLAALAADTELFTGAELTALCREAAMASLREDLEGATAVAARHFAAARAAMRPLLTRESLAEYAAWGAR